MKCLYAVLEVEVEADDGAIRTAYRKAALRWHPDKNQDNLAFAEERFKEIQNAYEILSDKHERAWYDSHRDAILRSGDRHQAGGQGPGDAGGQRPSEEDDLFSYFTSSRWSGFGDGPRGFYGVYNELFHRLAAAEAAAADAQGRRAPGPFPRFGASTAEWADVSAFYGFWGSFGTVKEFAWADQYNPASAPNRKVRRVMDAENDKARRAARREYNESVRELVGFLRKRDKRVAAHQVAEAARREARAEEERARRERERLERLERARQYKEAAWVAGGSEGSDGGEEEEDELDEEEDLLLWECPACDKHFRSEAAFDNHLRSKKHLRQVELLRAALEEEEAELAGDTEAAAEGASSSGVDVEEQSGSGSSSSSGAGEAGSEGSSSSSSSSSSASGSAASSSGGESSSGEEEDEDEGSEGEESEVGEDDMLARLVAAQRAQHSASSEEGSAAEPSEVDEGKALAAMLAAQHLQQQQQQQQQEGAAAAGSTQGGSGDGESSAPEDDPAAPQPAASSSDEAEGWDTSKARGGNAKKQRQQQQRSQKRTGGKEGEPPAPAPVAASSKQRGRGAKKQQPQQQQAPAERGSELECGVCGVHFGTRNQLFKHIKSSGHAAGKA